jgi:hypothetical protein
MGHYDKRNANIVKLACRLLHAQKAAVLCAMSHGQLTVDGFKIKPADSKRWTKQQLEGREIAIHHRRAKITWP